MLHAPRTALFLATSLVAIALAGAGCGPSANGVAQTPSPAPADTRTATTATTPAPTAAATPTPAPTTAPTPTAAPTTPAEIVLSGDFTSLEPGRRYAFPARGTNPRISFTAPSGWSGNENLAGKDYGDSGPVGPLLFPWPFDHGFKDPCTDHTPVVPAAGSGAAGLLRVIASQPGIDAGPRYGNSPKINDATVGGHDGKYIAYTVTVNPASCGAVEDPFWIWGSCPAPVTPGCEMVGTGDRRYGVSKDDRERAYAIDVDGRIVTFFTNRPADLLAADRLELQQVLASIEFEPAN